MEAKYIHRELSAVIEEAYRYFSVITVTGPRQSGKTTLLRNLFSYLPYYSLENLDVRSFAENDPVAFLNQHTEGMILDEVHNAPNLLSYIQGMVDNDADRRFILSGSSQFAMLKKVTQSLAGRTAVFELLPLSYSEIREQITDTPLDNLLFNGFYPAIYSGRNIPKFLYPAYMKTYLDKDVRDLLQIKDMMQFHTSSGFAPDVSDRCSKPLNWPTKSVSVHIPLRHGCPSYRHLILFSCYLPISRTHANG